MLKFFFFFCIALSTPVHIDSPNKKNRKNFSFLNIYFGTGFKNGGLFYLFGEKEKYKNIKLCFSQDPLEHR